MQRYLVTRIKVSDLVKILGVLGKLLRNIEKTGRRKKIFPPRRSDRKVEKNT
jgi:hypothetical protein